MRLRFGRTFFEEIPSPHHRFVYFLPHSVFSTLRWHGNGFGTILWQLSVLRTASPWDIASRISDVDPGAEVLLCVSGKTKIRAILSLICEIERQRMNPADVSPHYWRTLQHRLIARDLLPAYSRATHASYLRRLRMTS